jgi:transposase
MRGDTASTDGMLICMTPGQMVPKDHPLRGVRALADAALVRMTHRLSKQYSRNGRPSVPPEHLLRASLLQCFYGIRSERLLVEQIHYNLLFRWFVGLGMQDRVWDATTFTKNRQRLMDGDVAQLLLEEVIEEARLNGLTSDEHFSVDGTMIQAWASHKSFRPKDEPPDDQEGGPRERNFRGERRANDTHASTTDPDARLYRKSHNAESRLSYLGHVVTENRHGLVVGCKATHATGFAERTAAAELLRDISRSPRATVGADRGYDTRGFVEEVRFHGVTPHVAQNVTGRSSAIDGRTTRHVGYEVSQRLRKAVEHPFGWLKQVAGIRQVKVRGLQRVDWVFRMGMAAYDLIRIGRLVEVPA